MAEVFRALEPRPVGEPRVVVIKRMLPNLAQRKAARDMFRAEAKLGRRVQHANVVEVLGAGDEAGQPYLALEYVPGCDLWRLMRWLMREGRTLGVELAMFIVGELLGGLQAVHEARDEDGTLLGIVHRDVSPSNVLLSIHGDIKLGDLGIARAGVNEAVPEASLGERARGKLGYLAPEQIGGEVCNRATDLFSVGVIAAELLIGRPLFVGGSELAVLLAVRDGAIEPFLRCADSLPLALANAVKRALSTDPEARFTTSTEMASAILAGLDEAVTEGPDPTLRRQLAELVQQVAGTAERGLMAPGIDAATEGTPTPVVLFDEIGQPTTSFPDVAYRIRRPDGREEDGYSFAQVVEALATERLGADDLVAEAGGPLKPVREYESLRRHLPRSSLTPTTRQQVLAAPVEEMDLGEHGMLRALSKAARQGKTGLWLCSRGGARKEVYLKDGRPVFVTSNLAGELLGEFLVSRSVISRGELDMALAVMPRFEGRLGDTLAALGLVEPLHLFRHIEAQVREKLLDLFTWSGGTAAFYAATEPPPGGFPLHLDPYEVLDEGLTRQTAAGLPCFLDAVDRNSQVAVATGALSAPHLPAIARDLLQQLTAPRALAVALAWLERRGRDAGYARRLMAVLLAGGLVEIRD